MNINPCLLNSQWKNQYKHSNRAQYQTASARLGSLQCVCFIWSYFSMIKISVFSTHLNCITLSRPQEKAISSLFECISFFIRLQYVCKCSTFPFGIWCPIRCFPVFLCFSCCKSVSVVLNLENISIAWDLNWDSGLGEKKNVCKWSLRNRYCLLNVFCCRCWFLHIWLLTMMWKCILIIPVGSSTDDTFFFKEDTSTA